MSERTVTGSRAKCIGNVSRTFQYILAGAALSQSRLVVAARTGIAVAKPYQCQLLERELFSVGFQRRFSCGYLTWRRKKRCTGNVFDGSRGISGARWATSFQRNAQWSVFLFIENVENSIQ